MIDAADAVSYLIGARGNAQLAAARAQQDGHEDCNAAQILTAISSDPTSIGLLANQIRVAMLLQLFSTLQVTEMAYLERIDNLSAKDTAHTYTTLVKSIGDIVANAATPQNQNLIAAMMSILPPGVRESVQAVLTAGEGESDEQKAA